MKSGVRSSLEGAAVKLNRIVAWVALALVIATLAVYAPVRFCGFTNYDDQDYVTANEHVKAGLSWAQVKWAMTSGEAANWHPLTWISHLTDVTLFGLTPAGHHWTNVLLHAAATALLFIFLYRATRAVWSSAFVAALFALHPMHVESVAWIAERKDVLSGFFAMLTLVVYGEYVKKKTAGETAILAYTGVVMTFVLGLLAKPMLVTLPFVLLLLDIWPFDRFTKKAAIKVVLEKLPLIACAVASSIVTFMVQQKSGAVRNLEAMSADARVFNALISYWRYIGKLLWPTNLTVFYPLSESVSAWVGLLAGIGLVALTVMLFLLRKRIPQSFVGWLWFLGMLVPVIGIVQVGEQSMADRYSYLPSIGLFMAIAWAAGAFFQRARLLPAILGVTSLIVCTWMTERQIGYWTDTITLFRRTLDVTGNNNVVAHLNLGSAFIQQSRWDEALPHFQQAMLLRDDAFEAHFGAATVYEHKGNFDAALDHYLKAVERRPGDPVARNNAASLLIRRGEFTEAIAQLEKALAYDPNNASVHYNLGVSLGSQDRPRAIEHYRAAIRIRPDYTDARNNLAVALVGVGDFEGAIGQLKQVIKLHPSDAEAHFNLGFALGKAGKLSEAREEYRMAHEINPQIPLPKTN